MAVAVVVVGSFVVIDDFDVVGIAVFPAEADAPLLIDPDAELSVAASFECFQAVGGRNFQTLQNDGLADHRKLV